MNNTAARTPKTNGDYREILDTLPRSMIRRFGYMAEIAINDAGYNRTTDTGETAAETAAYNAAYAATIAWMTR